MQVPWSWTLLLMLQNYVNYYLEKHVFWTAVPDALEVKYLNLGMEEVRKELVGTKNREGIKNYVCVLWGPSI